MEKKKTVTMDRKKTMKSKAPFQNSKTGAAGNAETGIPSRTFQGRSTSLGALEPRGRNPMIGSTIAA